jgi:hypothetical protein
MYHRGPAPYHISMNPLPRTRTVAPLTFAVLYAVLVYATRRFLADDEQESIRPYVDSDWVRP